MNIPYTVLRTEMFGEEDWSIAVKKEHASRMPKGFKMEYFQHHSSEDTSAYEKQYPYTDIRYFVPNRDRLDEILCDISTGALRKRFTGILGDVYEGALSLKDALVDEKLREARIDRAMRQHRSNMHLLNPKEKTKYRKVQSQLLIEEYSIDEIAKILGVSSESIKNYTGIGSEMAREEKMIIANKRKRLARSLWTRGETLYEIADYLGISTELAKRLIGSAFDQKQDGDTKYAKVIQAIKDGRTQESIARELNIDRVTVYHYLRKYGEPVSFVCNKFDKLFKNEVMRLADEGLKVKAMSETLGCCHEKIRYYLKYNSAGHPIPDKTVDRDVITMYRKGKSVSDIADELYVSKSQVYNILKRNK